MDYPQNLGRSLNIRSQSIYYGASTILTKGIAFVVIMWLSSVLDVAEYSQFGILYAIQTGVATMVGAGVIEVVIGIRSQSNYTHNFLYKHAFIITVGTAIIAILIVTTYYLFADDEIPFYLAVFGGLLLGFSVFFAKIHRLQEKHIDSIMLTNIPIISFFLVGLILMYENQATSYMFFKYAVLGVFISLIILFYKYKEIVTNCNKIDHELVNIFLKNISSYIGVAILGWMSGYGIILLIDVSLSSRSVAIYTFLYTFSGVMLMLANSINQVWSPYFYKNFKQNSDDKLERMSYKYYSILAIVLLLSASFIISFYVEIINIIGGNALEYQPYLLELALILSSFIVYVPAWHCRNHMYVKLEGKNMLVITSLATIMGLIILSFLVFIYGDIGVYIGVFTISLLQSTFFVIYVVRKWKATIPYKSVVFSLVLIVIVYEANFILSGIWVMVISTITSIAFLSSINCLRKNTWSVDE